MKNNTRKAVLPLLLGMLALTGWVAPALAGPLDINGFVTPGDAACWTDPNCSLPRGGNSDVMTVNGPGGAIFAQNFAFGNEENNNLYYFDPAQVPVNSSMYGNYITLLEPDRSWSDVYGVARIFGVPGQALGWSWDFTGPVFRPSMLWRSCPTPKLVGSRQRCFPA